MINKYIAVVAGKSGGHIIPGMMFVKHFIEHDPDYNALFFSTDTQLDRSIIGLYPYVFAYIPIKLISLPGKKIWLYPLFLWQLLTAFFKSVSHLRKHRPDRVVSMGGYISIPVCLAARFLKIPVELFELNVVPGKAVLWLVPFARKIYVCFSEAKEYFKNKPVEVQAYPLRFSQKDRVTAAEARQQLGLNQAKKTILILGGSQGSRFINEAMLNFFKSYPELSLSIQVIHQAGNQNIEQIKDLYRQLQLESIVVDYIHELQYWYSAADLAIARAGAGTLFELEFFNKKSIIIPLETVANDHQVANALSMQRQRSDLFEVVRQEAIRENPAHLYQSINDSLRN